jgi:4-hydroxy-2-oxoheptanedioate aldolase
MNDPASLEVFLRNAVKARLEAGQLALIFTVRQWRTVDIARTVKACGYDGLYVDMEHSAIAFDATSQICTAALEIGLTPLVRVPSCDPYFVGQALDGGAMGIIAPHVETAEDARRAVQAAKYPPHGHRSISMTIPQLRYENWQAEHAFALINSETLIVPMIETQRGLDNVREIAAVDGVDVLMIGSNDLCADFGIHGQFDHARLRDAYQRTIDACRPLGKHVGIGGLGGRPELTAALVAAGARFVSAGTDQSFMIAAARERAHGLRALEAG